MIKETIAFKRLHKNPSYQKKICDFYEIIVSKLKVVKNIYPNYTDHGIRHAINVLETSTKIIDSIELMNDDEVICLCYICLGHDIGMAISSEDIDIQKKTNGINELVTFDNAMAIFNDELLALQACFRDVHGKLSYNYLIDIFNNNPHLVDFGGVKPDYLAKQISLACQSHTESINFIEDKLDFRCMTSVIINFKALAVLLRISDLIDNDYSRVDFSELYNIFGDSSEQRGVKYSINELKKNHSITNVNKLSSIKGDKIIVFQGECDEYLIHNKILSYMENIQEHLTQSIEYVREMDTKYKMDLYPIVKNDIRTTGFDKSNLKVTFDINAAFDMFIGENIYSSKKIAIREVIQNAIDAINQKLNIISKYESYIPEISLIINKEKDEFIIKDNGIGMNEHIITDYLLKIGKSLKKTEYLQLQYGVGVNIGRFGIGFFSLFMLSNIVRVNTRMHGSTEGYKLMLMKEDIHAVLEYDNLVDYGTEISLSLRDILKEFGELSNLFEYIKSTILFDDIKLSILPKDLNVKDFSKNNNIHQIKKGNDFSVTFDYSFNDKCYKSLVEYFEFNENNTVMLVKNGFHSKLTEKELMNLKILDKLTYIHIPILKKQQYIKYSSLITAYPDDLSKVYDEMDDEVTTNNIYILYCDNHEDIYYRHSRTTLIDESLIYEELLSGFDDELYYREVDHKIISKNTMFTIIKNNYNSYRPQHKNLNAKCKIYLKNILFEEQGFTFPYEIEGLTISNLEINFTSEDINFTIERSKFIDNDLVDLLYFDVCRQILMDIIKTETSSDYKVIIEKLLILYTDKENFKETLSKTPYFPF